jgi:arsenate reductase
MSEGLLRKLYGDRYEVYSAGTKPTAINPYAVKVMSEIGIDISANRSKSIEEVKEMTFDYVITVCDHAKEIYPFFPGAEMYFHKNFADPADVKGTENEILSVFRLARDEIREWIVSSVMNDWNQAFTIDLPLKRHIEQK